MDATHPRAQPNACGRFESAGGWEAYLVRVQQDEPDIDGLVRLKLLRQSVRKDPEALQLSRVAGRLEPVANIGHAL